MVTSTTQVTRPSRHLGPSEWIRTFLLVQTATFLLAATLHFGVFMEGYVDFRAGIPESVIASVLLAGLIATWIRPAAIRGIGLAAQGFGLAGTLVGLFTIVIGIGPRTVPDIVIHAVMLAELVGGLIVAYRARVSPARSSA
jgi:hypothetical protein